MRPAAFPIAAAFLLTAQLGSGAAGEPVVEKEKILDLRVTVPGGTAGKSDSIRVPANCTYVDHEIEVLERSPESALDPPDSGFTRYYTDLVRNKSTGRVEAVEANVGVTNAHRVSFLKVRLIVHMSCPTAADGEATSTPPK